MLAPLHNARQAYLRLASAVGPLPLTLLVSLIAVTAIAWAVTLYQPFAMSASGAFGYSVNLRAGRLGRWYCAAHRPQRAAP